MGLGLGVLGGKLHGPSGWGHGGIRILGFLEGLGEPKVGFRAFRDLGEHASVEGRRRHWVRPSAAQLEGARLEHE